MRAFLAVELPEAVRRDLARRLAELRASLPTARWVRADGLHLTLKFLGEQPEEVLARLADGVSPRLAGFSPVEVRLAGGGFFPSPRRPRVAWLGGAAPGLERWATAIEECARELGLPAEQRPFAIHLTLARLPSPWRKDAVDRFLAFVESWPPYSFEAAEAVLFRSELRPEGALYTALRRLAAG
jgi:RNA 2',3'-cyclic 3'-phosphodiesterase